MHLSSRSRAIALLVALWAPAAPIALNAQASSQPQQLPNVSLFTWDDAWLAGAFVLGTVMLRPTDEVFARRLQNPNNQANKFFNGLATTVTQITEPGSFIIGGSLYAIGRLSKQNEMADLGLHGTEAIVVGSAFAMVLKGAFGRARPYVKPPTDSTGFEADSWQFGRGFAKEEYRSFPSGHTVAAFAAAAAVSNEASRWLPEWKWVIGTAMYGGAALVGLSRMYNNRHWASDVMMGAAIGTFAGNKVVRYHHRTNPKNKLDEWLLAGSISPSADGGLAVSWSIAPRGW